MHCEWDDDDDLFAHHHQTPPQRVAVPVCRARSARRPLLASIGGLRHPQAEMETIIIMRKEMEATMDCEPLPAAGGHFLWMWLPFTRQGFPGGQIHEVRDDTGRETFFEPCPQCHGARSHCRTGSKKVIGKASLTLTSIPGRALGPAYPYRRRVDSPARPPDGEDGEGALASLPIHHANTLHQECSHHAAHTLLS